MMLQADRDDVLVGIVGAGLMGRGIAQIAAQAGVGVVLFDAREGAAAEARGALNQTFAMLAAKGKIAAESAAAAVARLAVATGLDDLAGCDVVIEAIVENLDAKRALFASLENVVGEDCVLATNTSSLSVTAIAAACRRPQRVGGFHFFSPVPLMKVVEVIDGVRGAAWVGDALTALARRMGHTPVRAKDTPGFIVNHAGRGYLTEALRIVSEGIADFHTVDRVLKGVAGFRLGPFELLDLTGLDVSQPVMESIHDQYYQEPRYRPSPIARQRLTAGLLGRKSGQGFYVYEEGKAQTTPPPAAPALSVTPVWCVPCAMGVGVAARLAQADVPLDTGAVPGPDALCLVFPLGTDATCTALDAGLDPARTVAVDSFVAGDTITIMGTPVTRPEMLQAAWGALAAAGHAVERIHDSPGFVVQRVLAMIVNIACDIAQQRIASPEDIDSAVTLGLGYPKGPLAWGDALGAARVLATLDALHAFYRDPRYRPSPWLMRRARLGVSLLTPEN